eukprot:759773-Hanusia_phi.AAC.1
MIRPRAWERSPSFLAHRSALYRPPLSLASSFLPSSPTDFLPNLPSGEGGKMRTQNLRDFRPEFAESGRDPVQTSQTKSRAHSSIRFSANSNPCRLCGGWRRAEATENSCLRRQRLLLSQGEMESMNNIQTELRKSCTVFIGVVLASRDLLASISTKVVEVDCNKNFPWLSSSSHLPSALQPHLLLSSPNLSWPLISALGSLDSYFSSRISGLLFQLSDLLS